MDNQEYNTIDNYAFYLFFFLSFISIGNDFYFVLQEISNHEIVKQKINYFEDFSNIIKKLLSNQVKKVKNGFEINEKKNKKKKIKEIKEIKNNKKQDNIKEDKSKKVENKIIQEFNNENDEYIENLNKLKVSYKNNIKKNKGK